MDAEALRALDVAAVSRLVDFAECPRAGDWTLRSALVRYAQRSPVAASAVLELVRRTDGALQPHRRALERQAVADVDAAHDGAPAVLDLLQVASVLDEIGDVLARWADDRNGVAVPVTDVDARAGRAFAMLQELGVPRETRPPRRAG